MRLNYENTNEFLATLRLTQKSTYFSFHRPWTLFFSKVKLQAVSQQSLINTLKALWNLI